MTRWQPIAVAAFLAAQVPVTTATPAVGKVLVVEPLYAPVSALAARRHCWKARANAGTAAMGDRHRTVVQTMETRREQVAYRVKYWRRGVSVARRPKGTRGSASVRNTTCNRYTSDGVAWLPA